MVLISFSLSDFAKENGKPETQTNGAKQQIGDNGVCQWQEPGISVLKNTSRKYGEQMTISPYPHVVIRIFRLLRIGFCMLNTRLTINRNSF